jgi:hypothetical protein
LRIPNLIVIPTYKTLLSNISVLGDISVLVKITSLVDFNLLQTTKSLVIMDPLSATASVVSMLDVVTRLGMLFYRIQSDMRTADKSLEAARQQVILLQQEIRMARNIQEEVSTEDATSPSTSTASGQLTMTLKTFTQALSVAESLLTDIEKSFPLTSGPLKWRTRMKYALIDKELCKTLGEKLRSVESTLQSILLFEQRYDAKLSALNHLLTSTSISERYLQ